MRKLPLGLCLFALAAFSGQTAAAAITVYYQPTPYPANTAGAHIIDGWLPSTYYGSRFQQDDKLQIGGWGDIYRTYLQFNLEGMPDNVSSATLQLNAYAKGDGSSQVGFDLYAPQVRWVDTSSSKLKTSLTWTTQPGATVLGRFPTPGPTNAFWGINITSTYNGWMGGTLSNYGLMISPRANNNNFNVWRSSRYTNDAYRPLIALTYTPPVNVPNFKMPLPRNISWLVTTEPGGYDCNGVFDSAHSGKDYFSIDFASDHYNSVGTRVYPKPAKDGSTTIPITPAADGIVAEVGTNKSVANGYYVVVSHDPSGSVLAGFSTRYLHLAGAPPVKKGQKVFQGSTTLGYMGNTGSQTTGTHLHFGVRYKDYGNSNTMVRYATMSGWLLKSFQTECTSKGVSRYYKST